MNVSFLKTLLAGATAAVLMSALRADDAREKTLRFPQDVVKSDSYQATPDADYHHASAAAYDQFRAMKYGVRIHWGLYSLLSAARESWTFLGLSNADRQKYLESYQQFNPQGFDAEGWMNFFDRAGFRCFAITTKHHEGFSLFDTKTHVVRRPNYSGAEIKIEDCNLAYSVMDTPFHRDIVKELTDAAHRHDIKVNLYFSHTDWYDADFRPYGAHPLQTRGSSSLAKLEQRQGRPAQLFPDPTPAERAHMMARHREQLRELLTNYGKVDMVCLDIGLGKEEWPELKETIKELRRIQPDVMFRNRGIGNYGDYYTPERVVPSQASQSPMPWMVIYPLGTNFSWEADGSKYKGAKWVVDNLVDSVAKGGNFMVGIGPNANGEFHPTAIKQLEEVGAWLKINGDAIFKSHQRPGNGWKEGDQVRLTASDDGTCVYAILLQRPAADVMLKTVRPAEGAKVVLLGSDAAVRWRATADGTAFELPASAAESLAYVLKIPVQL